MRVGEVLSSDLKHKGVPFFLQKIAQLNPSKEQLSEIYTNYAARHSIDHVIQLVTLLPSLLDNVDGGSFGVNNAQWNSACYLWDEALKRNPQLRLGPWRGWPKTLEQVRYFSKQPGSDPTWSTYHLAYDRSIIEEMLLHFPRELILKDVAKRYFDDGNMDVKDYVDQILDEIPFDSTWLDNCFEKAISLLRATKKASIYLDQQDVMKKIVEKEVQKMDFETIFYYFQKVEEATRCALIYSERYVDLVQCLKHKSNSLDSLSPMEHYTNIAAMQNRRLSLAKICNEFGFKVYQSIACELDYQTCSALFNECDAQGVKIIDDNQSAAFWKEQKKRWRQTVFYKHPQLVGNYIPLVKEKRYRVVVYASESEKRDAQGYSLPEILYDIHDASVDSTEADSYNPLDVCYHMSGVNAGDYEREWRARDTFCIGRGGSEFATGRDGGCLNCGGLYFVRILEE